MFCLRYPVVGTYRSLLWAVLHNERILQGKRNLITVSLFLLFFVYLLYIYRCFAVLKINWIITCEDIKQLRWFWDSFAHELTKLVPRVSLRSTKASARSFQNIQKKKKEKWNSNIKLIIAQPLEKSSLKNSSEEFQKSSKTGQELFKTIRALFKTAQLFEEALFEWPETETGNLKKPEEETSDKKKNDRSQDTRKATAVSSTGRITQKGRVICAPDRFHFWAWHQEIFQLSLFVRCFCCCALYRLVVLA